MNKNHLSVLQNIQESFAAWTGLTILISNRAGDLQTQPTWGSTRAKEQFDRYLTKEILYNFLGEFHSIPHTLLLDTRYGTKIIISPILICGRPTDHFIIAGLIVQRQSDEIVANSIEVEKTMPFVEKEYTSTDSDMKQKVEQITQMAKAIASIREKDEENRSLKKFSSLLLEKINSINSGSSTDQTILETGYVHDEIDFIGLALQSIKHRFTVQTIIGSHSDLLMGYEFEMGEGIMGYSIATHKPLFYEDITNDARNSVFLIRGMKVISLFCYPLFENEKVIGLLFAGSTQTTIKKTSFVHENLSACATLMNNHLISKRARHQMNELKTEISMVSSISKTYATVKDLKKSLYLLLDIGVNLVDFSFISLVYKTDPSAIHIEVQTRGMSEEEIQSYSPTVMSKLTNSENQLYENSEYVLSKTPWGDTVIEHPVKLDGSVDGILSIGIPSTTYIEKYKKIIENMAIAAGIALHLLRDEKAKRSRGDVAIKLIRKGVASTKPENYELAKQISSTASRFLKEFGIEDVSGVDTLSVVSVCNYDVLKSLLADEDLLDVVNEYKNVLDKNSGGDRLIETVAAVWTYYTNDQSIDSISDLELVNADIKINFSSFTKRQMIGVKTFSLNDGISPFTLKKLDLGLTKREEEVLKEMMKGYGNKEIGAILFISEHTVKNHITSILGKLEVKDRSQAFAKIYQIGYGTSS